jgi:outer membrane protein OmpA-like peptidoglycan-associated protein
VYSSDIRLSPKDVEERRTAMNPYSNRLKISITLSAFLILNLISAFYSNSPASATATNILNEGSNTGWSGGPLSINNSDGNPAPSLMFSKNEVIYKQYSDTGTDFAGTEISFDVKFIDVKDHIMMWWGAAGGGTGSVKQLLLGPGTNSGQRLAALGGLSNSGSYNGYYQTGTGTLTGTGNAGVTSGAWSINTWYTVKVAIGATSSSYYLNGTLIENKSTTLPTAGYVAIGGDDRDGWGFTNGVYVDNISVKVPKTTPTFSWANQTKAVGDANFRLTAPTSSTPGSFTYSSATSGVISLDAIYTDSATVGVYGTSVITASFTPTDSANYTSGTITMTITVNKRSQSAVILTLSSTSFNGTGSKAITFSTTGGTDTGTVSYSVKSGGTASGCALSKANTSTADTITATSTGTCLLQAVKAATANYATETSTAVTFNFLAAQTFAYDSGTATSGTVPTGGTYYAGDTITVSSGSGLSKPGFKLNGWKNSSNVSYAVGSTFTISTSDTLTAQWRQASLFGISDADLTEVQNWNVISGFSAGGNIGNGTDTFTVTVPANALTAGTSVKLYALSSSALAQSKIGSGNTYILNMVVAWLYGQTVPTASSAVTLKIESPSIKKDAVAYMIIGDTVTAVGTATQDGVINTFFTDDPVITVVNPVVQNNNGGGGGGGNAVVTVEKPVEVVAPVEISKPVTSKLISMSTKVYFGLNASWINSVNIKGVKNFIAKVSASASIKEVTIQGFTQPTAINPDPFGLSKARANSVAKLVKGLGITNKVVAVGKGNEKKNLPTSRYVLVTVTGEVKS